MAQTHGIYKYELDYIIYDEKQYLSRELPPILPNCILYDKDNLNKSNI